MTHSLQEVFTVTVHGAFDELRSRSMAPNEACALALRIAAGLASMPPTVSSLRQALHSAPACGSYEAAAQQLYSFLSNPDAVHASFWTSCQRRQVAALPMPPLQLPAVAVFSGAAAPLPAHAGAASTLPAAGGSGSSDDGPAIDMDAIHELHDELDRMQHHRVQDALQRGATALVDFVCSASGRSHPGLPRAAALLLTSLPLQQLESHELLYRLAGALTSAALPEWQRRALEGALCCWGPWEARRAVVALQQYTTLTLYSSHSVTPGVEAAVKLLAMLSRANNISHALHPSEFYNDAVNSDDFNLKEDFRRWRSPTRYPFSFCSYSFVYDPSSKARLLQLESTLSQYVEFESTMLAAMLGGGGGCPYLVLRVRRGPYLLQDTLVQINRAKEQGGLKKPLKVKFVGEEGIDEGGVQKEFFQLLVRQCFNPEFGMFSYDQELHLHWFQPSVLDMDMEFELIGILVGLAIYNGHILEFQFPLVLYKLLLQQQGSSGDGAAAGAAAAAAAVGAVPPLGAGTSRVADAPAGTAADLGSAETTPGVRCGCGAEGGARGGVGDVTLDDLSELHPDIHASLTKLLEMPAQQVNDLGLTFQVDSDIGFGERRYVELLPGCAAVPVSAANRSAYVAAYAQHLLVGRVARQLQAFRRGFLRLCSGATLQFFRPFELEQLVCGGQRLALEELQAATVYDDGYTMDSPVVHWFWEVAHSLDDGQKKRLLSFITGTDRVPIKGLGHLSPPFVISRNGPHSERLPTAHTCFNHLLLPEYADAGTLRRLLLLAIENAEGFGLM